MHGDGGTAMSAAVDVRPALLGHLKDLHLPTVRECYEDTARRAERETLSYEQYLLEVISREIFKVCRGGPAAIKPMKKDSGQALRLAGCLAADGKANEAIEVLEWKLKPPRDL